jgi:hypothetical protein
MKTYLLFFLITLSTVTLSQDFSDLDPADFATKEDCKKNERRVLDCVTYILSNPVNEKDKNRNDATAAMIVWMTNTPDFSFEIDESLGPLMKKNNDIIGLLMASMAKVALENKNQTLDKKQMKLNSFKMLLEYCSVPANNVKMTKELQKAIEQMKAGKLEEYLKMKN